MVQNIIQTTQTMEADIEDTTLRLKKEGKRGIIYISTIPKYMNASKIREYFGEFGEIGRVYLQLSDKEVITKEGKLKKKKVARKFSEGWVEFGKKSVAKKVAAMLNNTQVSNRKKSKLYDSIWNIKYLSGFKWTHLHERLAYEKAAKRQKLRAEIQVAKKNSSYFTINLDKKKKNKKYVNKEFENLPSEVTAQETKDNSEHFEENGHQFLQDIFS